MRTVLGLMQTEKSMMHRVVSRRHPEKDLVEVTVAALAPIKERYEAIRNSDELLTILNDGAEKADAIAQKTMQRVRAYFGLGTGY